MAPGGEGGADTAEGEGGGAGGACIERRKKREKGEEGLIKRGEERGGEVGGRSGDRAVQVKEIWDGADAGGGEAAMQSATLGLSPGHCQPDNGLISPPFTPV